MDILRIIGMVLRHGSRWILTQAPTEQPPERVMMLMRSQMTSSIVSHPCHRPCNSECNQPSSSSTLIRDSRATGGGPTVARGPAGDPSETNIARDRPQPYFGFTEPVDPSRSTYFTGNYTSTNPTSIH